MGFVAVRLVCCPLPSPPPHGGRRFVVLRQVVDGFLGARHQVFVFDAHAVNDGARHEDGGVGAEDDADDHRDGEAGEDGAAKERQRSSPWCGRGSG